MAAHHQVAALDLLDIHLGWQRAADGGAQLLEPRAIAILPYQFVVVVGDVLAGQRQQRDEVQGSPAEPASPGLAPRLPVQLQRLVFQVEQRLGHSVGGAGRVASLEVFRGDCLEVFRLARGGQVEVADCRLDALWLLLLQGIGECPGYREGARWDRLFRRDRSETQRLGHLRSSRSIGRVVAFFRLAFGAQQLFCPGFVGMGLWRVLQFLQLAGQFAFFALELGQFLVEVQVVEIEVVMNPERFLFRHRFRRARRNRRRGWFDGSHGGRCYDERLAIFLLEALGRIEYLQTGATAHDPACRTELSTVQAETGSAMGALGDEAGHAQVRRRMPASLAHAWATAAEAGRRSGSSRALAGSENQA